MKRFLGQTQWPFPDGPGLELLRRVTLVVIALVVLELIVLGVLVVTATAGILENLKALEGVL